MHLNQALAENAALKAAMTKQDYRIAHLVQMLNEEEAKNRRWHGKCGRQFIYWSRDLRES